MHVRWFLGPASAVALLLVVGARDRPAGAQRPTPVPSSPTVVAVTFPAGWNLVANPGNPSPDSNILTDTDGPIYCYQLGDTAYEVIPPGEPMRGEACWAYFDAPATEMMSAGFAVVPHRIQVPAGQWLLVGNPSAAVSGYVLGATHSLVYNPATGSYEESTVLGPAQGAWAYSATGGYIATYG